MKKKLVLFDFDGTITTRDTLLEFIRYYRGWRGFATGFLVNSPWLVLMRVKMFPNWRAKEKILSHFFAGESIEAFERRSTQFCREVVPQLIRPGALDEIERHRKAGATIVVVTASAEQWVRPWCEHLGLRCIATALETKDGVITGRIKGMNCHGPEKENRIRSCYNLSEFEDIVAYGDSSGDYEMLALATEKYYKPFR